MNKEKLLQRFLKYVKIWTTSDSEIADSGLQPSTERQLDLANVLFEEMKNLGLENCTITEHGYVYGKLSASNSDSKNSNPSEPFFMMAHMDTAEDCSGENVQTVLIEGKDEFGNPDTIIKTDGQTLLGADDKAGVAAIMNAVEYFSQHPEIKHGDIEIVFSPDEETGHGMDNFENDLLKPGIFKSKSGYTVDGGTTGEIETECFNAYKVEVTFSGIATHTGSAKNRMVNAIFAASKLVESIPLNQRPETTENFEGFFAVMGIEGTIECAKVHIFLRDFEKDGMQKRLNFIWDTAEKISRETGAKVDIKEIFQYENMKEGISKNPQVLEKLVDACKKCGINPVFPPIRGGTDGSRLTEMGIPTPNIFTGGHNYHSKDEWCSLNGMFKASEILVALGVEK